MKLADLEAAAALVNAAQRGARVGWLHPVTGDLVTGTARRLTKDNHTRVRHDDDVMTLALEITTSGGREMVYGLDELIEMVQAMTFVIDYATPVSV